MHPPAPTVADFLTGLYNRDPSSGVVQFVVEKVLLPLGVFLAIWVGGRTLRRTTARAMKRAGADAQVRTLVANIITVGTIVLAVSAALTHYGITSSVLLTFGGLFSLAVGFAFQDLLRNVLAGIFLLLERPFHIGDEITVGEQGGIVQTIRLRTTELKTLEGVKVILPNLAAFTNPVINRSAYKIRRFHVIVWAPAGADINRAVRIARRELAATRELLADPPAIVIPKVDVDAGATLLRAEFWMDYRRYDAEVVCAGLALRLRVAVGATVEQASAGADGDVEPPIADDGAPPVTEAPPSKPPVKPARRRLPRLPG